MRNRRAFRTSRKVESHIHFSITGCPKGLGRAFRHVSACSLATHGIVHGELDIAFVDKAAMKRLHTRWLGQNSATDVITFDLRKRRSGPRAQRHNDTVDGQIVVCTDVAREEARRRRQPWQRELALYVIHGCLHLCGYDDRRAADAARMAREQNRLLKSCRI